MFSTPEEFFTIVPELKSINLELCVSCKGTQLKCGMNYCPILKAFEMKNKVNSKIETISFNRTIHGPSPQVFIGSTNYPNVMSGPTSVLFPDDAKLDLIANPAAWNTLSLDEVIEMRFNLSRNMKQLPVNIVRHENSFVENMQEIALSTRPVDIEGELLKPIQFSPKVDPISQPFGPSLEIKKFKLVENPKIPQKVDTILSDELSTFHQLNLLDRNGFDVYYIQNIFSTGLMGKADQRKIVPTRWTITAVDDTLGKTKLRKIRDFPPLSNILAFHGGLFGNYFTIVLFPGLWMFENFEAWGSNSIFTLGTNGFLSLNDEGFNAQTRYNGKSSYASQAGGYYAARLAVLEYLEKIGKQAMVVSIREITNEYTVPAGVWVVREAARKTLATPPTSFSSRNELLEWIHEKIRRPLIDYSSRSKILAQQSLLDFF